MANYCNIDQYLYNYLKGFWVDKKFHGVFPSRTWQYNRYIQISTPVNDSSIHYEYRIDNEWNGLVELHIEGRYTQTDYMRFLRYLQKQTETNPDLSWHQWGKCKGRCSIKITINNWEDIKNAFQKLITFFDPLLTDCIDKFNLHKKNEISSPYTRELEFKELTNSQEKVVLETKNLQDLFSSNLVIPDYQRTYCWEDKNVTDLWDNLLEMPHNSDYHLGSIILQRRTVNDCTLYNIIDGQQRLVTLTLIMRELGYTGQMPLLKQKFISKDARLHVANNKALIRILNQRNTDIAMLERLSHHLIFSVLILNDSNLDLAYTFFSNQNFILPILWEYIFSD